MQATLLLSDGSTAEASKDAITQELASTKPFWLDLVDIDATALSWLSDVFKFHSSRNQPMSRSGPSSR